MQFSIQPFIKGSKSHHMQFEINAIPNSKVSENIFFIRLTHFFDFIYQCFLFIDEVIVIIIIVFQNAFLMTVKQSVDLTST